MVGSRVGHGLHHGWAPRIVHSLWKGLFLFPPQRLLRGEGREFGVARRAREAIPSPPSFPEEKRLPSLVRGERLFTGRVWNFAKHVNFTKQEREYQTLKSIKYFKCTTCLNKSELKLAPIFKAGRLINTTVSIWRENMFDYLSLDSMYIPQTSQFFSSYALFASQNR